VEAIAVVGPASGDSAGGQLSEAALGAALARADINALAQVYDRYHIAVFAVAYRVINDRTLAEDVVQDVFISLWKNPAAYRPERGSVGTWLMAAAHNKAVDLVRHEESHRRRRMEVAARAEQQLREEKVSEPVEDMASERWQAERVRDALARLPEQQREAMVLAYYGGFTQREVAAITNVPIGTVKTRMLAAMRKLRDGLSPLVTADGLPGRSGLEGGG
jgi:RNA polymerase sigma factor (sigma-70 family)